MFRRWVMSLVEDRLMIVGDSADYLSDVRVAEMAMHGYTVPAELPKRPGPTPKYPRARFPSPGPPYADPAARGWESKRWPTRSTCTAAPTP